MSQHFKDRDGRDWAIELTFGEVQRIREASRFDLLDPGAKLPAKFGEPATADALPLEQALSVSYADFWDLLWFIIEPQANEKNVSACAFGKAMGPECLVAAEKAFFCEWRDFFRLLERSDLSKLLDDRQRLTDVAKRAVKARLQDPRVTEMDAEIEAGIERLADSALTKALTDGSGKLRALLESAQTNLPS